MRKTKFEAGKHYHIYNRGVDKRNVFFNNNDFARFVQSIREFNRSDSINSLYRLNQNKAKTLRASERLLESSPITTHQETTNKLVELICYALIPNHFHFILKQLQDKGIPKFMHKIGMGYTNYFNAKYKRNGGLFQGTYKSVPITSEGQLLRLSCYINGNPEIHKIAKAKNWIWSSYQDYLNLRNGTLCNKSIILRDFPNIHEYEILTNEIIKESQKQKTEIKNNYLE